MLNMEIIALIVGVAIGFTLSRVSLYLLVGLYSDIVDEKARVAELTIENQETLETVRASYRETNKTLAQVRALHQKIREQNDARWQTDKV